MAIIRKWSGDDIDGFDSELSMLYDDMAYDTSDGQTHLAVTGTGPRLMAWSADIGPLSQHAARVTLALSAWPSGTQVIAAPLDSAGSVAYRVSITSTGTLVVRDRANGWAGATYTSMTAGTRYRIEWWASTADMEVRVFNDETGDQLDTASLTGKTFGNVTNFRFGQINPSPDIPPFHIHDVALSDTQAQIGAKAAPSPVDHASPRVAIIGDSLTAMSGANGSYLYDRLPDAGVPTRQTYLWGVGGKKITGDDLTGRDMLTNIADARTQMLGTVDHWLLALGTNNTPDTDTQINAAIDAVLAALDGDRVTWVGLTYKTGTNATAARVNNLIQAKLSGYSGQATYADWGAYIHDPAHYDAADWISEDATHMTPQGYAKRADYYASLVAPPVPAGPVAYVGSTPVAALYLGENPVETVR